MTGMGRHAGWGDIGIARGAAAGGSLRDRDAPFVLLDDARAGRKGVLYHTPVDVATANYGNEVRSALEAARGALRRGLHVAGYIGYGAGLALEERLGKFLTEPSELLWLGFFERCDTVEMDGVGCPLDGGFSPGWDEASHAAAVGRALEYVRGGDIYQVNLSFPVAVEFSAHPMAHYAHLRRAQRAGWGGVVHTGARWLLSCSPELFFSLEGGRLLAKPMKGTAARGRDEAEDGRLAAGLHQSAKDRAENLMIVDLLRNDFSRVAAAGSVRVPALFDVETYPTLHQMTSSVTARLREGMDAVDVLAAIFPCGSVTGAPKIRAMEIIAELEGYSRGAYTGSIGATSPDGDAAFNVAIRTLEYAGDGPARLCVGSAIVADSSAAAEWAECLTKLAFSRWLGDLDSNQGCPGQSREFYR
jgi:para-aminobenzoate synthetase/4-amino-4-deoxychorismate lyase